MQTGGGFSCGVNEACCTACQRMVWKGAWKSVWNRGSLRFTILTNHNRLREPPEAGESWEPPEAGDNIRLEVPLRVILTLPYLFALLEAEN